MKPSLNDKTVIGRRAGKSESAGTSSIPRGAYLHRQGEVEKDEQLVADFWRQCGFEVTVLEDARQRFSALPDLLLSRDGRPWAYCEVKTIWQHKWKIRVLHEGRVTEERTEFNRRPVNERVEGDLLTALRQLRAGNPDHSLSNIVVLINRDPEASLDVIKRVLAATPPASRLSLKARMAAKAAEEVQQFRQEVDLCLWADGLAGEKPAIDGYFLFNSRLRNVTSKIAVLSADKQISFEPAA